MKRLAIYTLTALSFFTFSCDSDDETVSEVTTEMAKATMLETDVQTSSDIVGITQTEGIDGLRSFFNLIGDTDPFGGRSDVSHEEYRGFVKKQTRLFRQIFNVKKSLTGKEEEDDFNFEENKGIYDWNFGTEDFERAGDSEIIVLNFPTENSQTNNATLRITDYEEVLIIDDGYEEYYPTKLAADLTINEALVIDADATVAYNDYGDPVSGNISLQLVPYTFSLVFDDTASTSASLSASISEGGETIVGVDLTVTFDAADKEEVTSVSGSVQYGDLKVKGDITNLDGESEDINDFINLEVFENDTKLGDIIFIEELDGNDLIDVPYIKYNDGTTENLEDLFEDTIIELEDFFDELEDWG
jgi:uncharacterized protein YaiE (UPF0345 family)